MNSYKIAKNIRLSSLSHMLFPLLIIACVVVLLINIPFKQIFFPTEITLSADTPLGTSMAILDGKDEVHCRITFPTLEYTGYDLIRGNHTVGSYYYYVHDTTCIFVILDTHILGESADVLTDYTITACREEYNEMFDNMLSLYAHDILWTEDGLRSSSVGFLLSEIEHHPYVYKILFGTCVFLLIVSSFIILQNLIYFVFPYSLHPTFRLFRKLLRIKLNKQERALRKLDMELSGNSVENFGSTYITGKYLVDSNKHTSVIIPLKHIVWVYSAQRLKKILWFNIKLSSFMTIVTDTGHTVSIHWKPSDDARQVYSYLEEIRPDILFKYSKANKIEAKRRIKEAKKNIRLAKKRLKKMKK